MGGQSAIRGFLLQTIVSLLDAVELDHDWVEVTLEPNISSEKVDILFLYKNKTSARQVKSSQNQITKALVSEWTAELKNSVRSDDYTLILIGPVSQSVLDESIVNGVAIPLPKVLDTLALIEQAAHKLDKYLQSRGFLPIPAFIREEFISVLITKFELFSTVGKPMARSAFDNLIQNWIIEIYPKAIMTSFNMQCALLVDSIVMLPGNPEIPILLPCVFLNDGNRTAIVEWIAFKVTGNNITKLYTPVSIVDYEKFLQGKRTLHGENLKSQFSEFAVSSKSMKEMAIVFTQEVGNIKFPPTAWTPGKYELNIFIKYQDSVFPKLQKTIELPINTTALNDIVLGGITVATTIRKIVID